MKYLLKHYKFHILFISIIYIPIILICTIRTKYNVILKGDTEKFESVVDVDTNYEVSGSFSTIYVISFNHSTIFQNILSIFDTNIEKYEPSKKYNNLTDIEEAEASKLDYYSSIELAIINAYDEAKLIKDDINIDYSFKSFDVTWYKRGSQFKIGDKVVGHNDIVNDSREKLYESLKEINDGDIIHIIRNNKNIDITWKKDVDAFTFAERFNIDYKTINPKVKINYENVGGPSGGLLQTLCIYNQLIEEDLTKGKKISGTGTIEYDKSVGKIGGIKEKVPTAYDDNIDIFFCPSGNYDDALVAYNKLKNKDRMKLVKVDKLSDAIDYLRGL